MASPNMARCVRAIVRVISTKKGKGYTKMSGCNEFNGADPSRKQDSDDQLVGTDVVEDCRLGLPRQARQARQALTRILRCSISAALSSICAPITSACNGGHTLLSWPTLLPYLVARTQKLTLRGNNPPPVSPILGGQPEKNKRV
jgi:hypothetical protein